MNGKIPEGELREPKEQVRRSANLLRLEGNYVAAQEAERQLLNLTNKPPIRIAV